ncbi:hypothetical protein I312_105393 [Cryptococcus bacillisporus CA1280]|uniref:uncharacterized protein n=1 Tax=Cryptococcus bacillisporus CA1280 TaxID=1296109 RepID=UPI0033672C95
MIMPSVTAAILLRTFCSWARAVPACVRGTTAAATTSSGLKPSIIYAQLPVPDSGTDQGLSSTQGSGNSNGFLATTSKTHSWSSSNFDGTIRITTAVAPTQATSAAQALTSAAHTAESSRSSRLLSTSEKIATSAAQLTYTREECITNSAVLRSYVDGFLGSSYPCSSTETSLTTLTLYKTDLQRSWDTTNQWSLLVHRSSDCSRNLENSDYQTAIHLPLNQNSISGDGVRPNLAFYLFRHQLSSTVLRQRWMGSLLV